MDSLLSNYASSDDEENEQQQPKTSSSIFSSLPPPKSSLFNSLPPPKSHFSNPPQTLANPSYSKPSHHPEADNEELKNSRLSSKFSQQFSKADEFTGPAIPPFLFSSLPEPKSSSIFSSLPPPKCQKSSDPLIPSSPSSSLDPIPKKVVQFRPPVNRSFLDDEDEDDDDKEKQSERAKDIESSAHMKQSLSTMLPAPKNSVALGALPSSSGTGRRSILEAVLPASNSNGVKAENEVSAYSNVGNYEAQWVDGSSSTSLGAVSNSSEYAAGSGAYPSNWGSESGNFVSYDTYGGYVNGGDDSSNWGSGSENYANYDNNATYGHYDSNWVGGSTVPVANDISGVAESAIRIPGKRGRKDVPQEIVEVKQDELMKNRPREDQVKVTGVAFGPAYQPVSTKGKPTKLHKRKHQIGSLFYDMKQNEMELAERRSKGFLTKAETQAKYGW